MFIRYENLTGNFIGFFSSLDLNKQHTRINGFFAQADIEKGKRKRFSFVELFGCCFFVIQLVWILFRMNVWKCWQLKPMSWHKICHMSILIWREKYVRKQRFLFIYFLTLIVEPLEITNFHLWSITFIFMLSTNLDNLIGNFDVFTG